MDATYELISEVAVQSGGSQRVDFNSIPQNYKDLIIVGSLREESTNTWGVRIRFNNSAAASYSTRVLQGSGSSAVSATSSSDTSMNVIVMSGVNSTANTFGNFELYIPNYTSTTNKSISATSVSENNATEGYIRATAGIWSQTSPITDISFFVDGLASDFNSGSTFYLYGIKNADDGGRGFFGPAMTGGDEVYTTGNGYKVHVFKNSGTLNVTAPGEVEYLVIAGGGGGGRDNWTSSRSAGGGGAGGYRSSVDGENSGGGSLSENKLNLLTGSYPVIVGAGGAAGSTNYIGIGSNGTNSNLYIINSAGGGGGTGNHNASPYVANGQNGGSGGGGPQGGVYGGLAIAGQGYKGGDGNVATVPYGAGGGGGAGQAGGNADASGGGVGGNGLNSSITGSSIQRAAGGGSMNSNGAKNGGSGGGGAGGGNSGTAFTGSGGGGNRGADAGNGGSGIVIIRYRI